MGRKFLEVIKIYLKNSCPVLFFAYITAFLSFFPSCFSAEIQSQEAIKEEGSSWNPYSAGPVITWTAPLCGRAKFVAQPFFFYNHTRGMFNSDGGYNSLRGGDKKYQYQQQLFMEYGITEHFEIDAQTLYQENYIKQSGATAHSEGLGDSFLFLRYCPIEDKGFMPSLNGLFQIKFPTGKFQHLNPDKLGADLMGATTGGGSYDHGYGVILTKKLKPFILHADLIYNFPLETKVDSVKTRYGRYLNCDVALEYFFTDNINFIFEVNNLLQQDKKEEGSFVPNSNKKETTISPGIGWSNEKIQMLLAYQRIIIGENADADDSAVFTFVYNF
jgi:hypothetical protein